MQINIWLILSSIIIRQTLHASRGPWFTITDTFWVDYFLFFDHAFETFVKFKSIISGFVSWDFNLIKKRSTIVRSFRVQPFELGEISWVTRKTHTSAFCAFLEPILLRVRCRNSLITGWCLWLLKYCAFSKLFTIFRHIVCSFSFTFCFFSAH